MNEHLIKNSLSLALLIDDNIWPKDLGIIP